MAVVQDSGRERSLESLALGAGAISFALVGLVALAVFRLGEMPIAGPDSLGQFAALASAVVAVVAYVAGRYVVRRPGHALRVLDIVDVAALAFAHAVIALLSWTLLAVILERGFRDATVFGLPSMLIAGTAAAVTAYVVFFSSSHMDLQLLALVLAIFLIEGIIASMLTASDPHWWQDNLSALGMTDDTPLAYWFRHERAARIYDGADEVHKSVVARRILKGYGVVVRE